MNYEHEKSYFSSLNLAASFTEIQKIDGRIHELRARKPDFSPYFCIIYYRRTELFSADFSFRRLLKK